MNPPRTKFFVALTIYVGWIAALGAMAWLSADRPQVRPPAQSPR